MWSLCRLYHSGDNATSDSNCGEDSVACGCHIGTSPSTSRAGPWFCSTNDDHTDEYGCGTAHEQTKTLFHSATATSSRCWRGWRYVIQHSEHRRGSSSVTGCWSCLLWYLKFDWNFIACRWSILDMVSLTRTRWKDRTSLCSRPKSQANMTWDSVPQILD